MVVKRRLAIKSVVIATSKQCQYMHICGVNQQQYVSLVVRS